MKRVGVYLRIRLTLNHREPEPQVEVLANPRQVIGFYEDAGISGAKAATSVLGSTRTSSAQARESGSGYFAGNNALRGPRMRGNWYCSVGAARLGNE